MGVNGDTMKQEAVGGASEQLPVHAEWEGRNQKYKILSI